MFTKQFDIVRLRNVCLISIVLAKSFNLIPMSKKSMEFFQSVQIFPTAFVRIFDKVIWEHCIGLEKIPGVGCANCSLVGDDRTNPQNFQNLQSVCQVKFPPPLALLESAQNLQMFINRLQVRLAGCEYSQEIFRNVPRNWRWGLNTQTLYITTNMD